MAALGTSRRGRYRQAEMMAHSTGEITIAVSNRVLKISMALIRARVIRVLKGDKVSVRRRKRVQRRRIELERRERDIFR
jgi:hypothetical protein